MKPHVLFTPRNVPIPMKIKSPARTETNGAAQGKSSVTDSTPWCVGMMVMPKKSGAVRIHVDIKPLND